MINFDNQVDVVYLWVNSNDTNWQKKRRKSFEAFLKTNKDDTLRSMLTPMEDFVIMVNYLFNLRCLEKFFPDHGHIYHSDR